MIIRSVSLRQNPAYRPGNSRPSAWLVAATVLLAACRARVPEQVLSSPTPVVSRGTEEMPRSWTIRPGVAAREYRIVQLAEIVATADSAGPQTDSTSVTVDASIRNIPRGGVAGLIRSVAVSSPGTSASPLPGIALPLAFAAPEPRSGAQASLTTRPAAAEVCGSPAQVPLGALRDLLIHVPDSVFLGREWADSGTFVMCREGVRLEVFSRRQFTLTRYQRRDSLGVLLVTRLGTTTIQGLSVRGEDTTRVEGSGTNSLRYELDSTTGEVLSTAGTGSLDIFVRGAVKIQRARQTSALTISIRTP